MSLRSLRLSILFGALVASVLVTAGAGRAGGSIETSVDRSVEANGPRAIVTTPAVTAPAVAEQVPVASELPADEPVHPLYHSSLSDGFDNGSPSGEIASKIRPLDSAGIGAPSLAVQEERAQPVRLRVAELGIDAEIIPVGVTEDGDYEVPPASQVGWYRFGSAPGDPGSAVLAAHIAWNGVDGVFRHLADLPAGAEIEVVFDDGSTVIAVSGETERIDKDELPSSLFDRSGEPRIVLITCGGAFNRSLRSYEDNIIAVSKPAT